MAMGFSQSEMFFQLQMAAPYRGTQLFNTIQGSAIFGVSLRRTVECSPGLPLGQHYKVTISLHCRKSVHILRYCRDNKASTNNPVLIQLEEEEEDKMLCLTEAELVRVLEDQMTQLLRSCPDGELPVPELLNTFMRFHGHGLRLQDYGVNSVCELVMLIPNTALVRPALSTRLLIGKSLT